MRYFQNFIIWAVQVFSHTLVGLLKNVILVGYWDGFFGTCSDLFLCLCCFVLDWLRFSVFFAGKCFLGRYGCWGFCSLKNRHKVMLCLEYEYGFFCVVLCLHEMGYQWCMHHHAIFVLFWMNVFCTWFDHMCPFLISSSSFSS